MYDDVSRDEAIIKECQEHIRNTLALIGWIDADADYWKAQQEKIIKINKSKFATSSTEEVEMLKNVRHRKDGRWEYRKQKNKQILYIIKPTKQKLLDAIREQTGKTFGVRSKKKFKVYKNYWFETFKKQNLKESSANMYDNILTNHLSVLDNFDMNQITLEDAQKVVNSKTGRVRELVFLTLRQIFKRAYFEDIIKKDIGQFLIKGKIERNERRNLKFSEQKILWESLGSEKFSLLIRFYLLTGCRREEAKITKENLFQEEDGCYVYIEGTKTRSSRRYVKISQKLYDALQNVESDFIFYHDYKSIEKRFRSFVQSLGLKITIHQLRHTCNTNWYVIGVPDKKRQTYLGHSSIILTNDVYTHEDPTLTASKIKELYGDWLI